MSEGILSGRRVLLVEDEQIIAMLLEDILEDEDCTTIGPYGDLDSALAAARSETMDAALLDVNLAGELVFPVAEVLASRRVPFLLLSGYGAGGLPTDHQDWPVCNKPFRAQDVISKLGQLIVTGS